MGIIATVTLADGSRLSADVTRHGAHLEDVGQLAEELVKAILDETTDGITAKVYLSDTVRLQQALRYFPSCRL